MKVTQIKKVMYLDHKKGVTFLRNLHKEGYLKDDPDTTQMIQDMIDNQDTETDEKIEVCSTFIKKR